MERYNFKVVEEKWQLHWEKSKFYKTNLDFSKKKLSGTYYHDLKELDSFVGEIFPIFNRSNPLHPDILHPLKY